MWYAETQLNKPADNAFKEQNVILTTNINQSFTFIVILFYNKC